jgi:hypothetical protein
VCARGCAGRSAGASVRSWITAPSSRA